MPKSSSPLILPAPLFVAAGAVYPYSDELLAMGERKSRFGDKFNLFRAVGSGNAARVWVPRGMAPVPTLPENYRCTYGVEVKFRSSFSPRNDEQARVVAESHDLLAKGCSFLTECPTGFGKTPCALQVISLIGRKTLVIVPKEDVRDAWIKQGKSILGLDPSEIGLIQGDTFQVAGRKLVIAMVQTIAASRFMNISSLGEFGLTVWDEVHLVGADYFSQSCFRVPGVLRWGLSATPKRKDGREEVIYAHIGKVRVRSESLPMVPRVYRRESGWKVPLVPRTDPETGARTFIKMPHGGKKMGGVLTSLINDHLRNSILSKFSYDAYKSGRTLLVQSDRKEHLDTLSLMIQAHGVPLSHLSWYVGGLSQEEREEAKHKQIILATYQMTAYATDIPWVDTLVMGTPRSDVEQIVGRVIRFMENKREPLVFDLVDSDSSVLKNYAKARDNFYKRIGAKVMGGPMKVIKGPHHVG